jgi:hypothetical protein
MKNDEFDRRVRAFFAGAPRPAAPDALRRLPGRLAVADGGAPLRSKRVHRGPALAGTGMAGLVVVALAVALVVRFPGGHSASSGEPAGAPSGGPAVTSSPSTTASTTPSAPRPAYAMDGLAWQEVGVGTFDGVESLALFPIDQGMLVVGTSRTAQVRLWLTTDGVAFRPLDASAFASDDPVAHQVFVFGLSKGPGGYLAVGGFWTAVSTGTMGPASPLVWHSTDGAHWSRVETQGLPASGLSYLAATNRGFVVAAQPDWTTTPITAFPAYESADGISWQATSITAVKVFGHDGHVVALTRDQAVAVTEDGTTWTTLRPAAQVIDVATSPDGFLAAAHDQTTTKWRAITSPDGHNWTTVGTTSTSLAASIVRAMGKWMMFGQTSGGLNTIPLLTSSNALDWQSNAIPQQVIGTASLSSIPYTYQDGFFAQTQVELSPGGLTAYGPLQVHLWWVRAARAGDSPGATAPPEPTFEPVATPTGGITEARAIEIASARYPNTLTQPYGKLVPIGGFDSKQTLVSPDRWVWAVMVIVPKPGCSGKAPGPSPCELPYSSLTVIVDDITGDIIEVLDSNGVAVP